MRWRDVRPSQSQPGTFILRGGEGREGTGRCAAGAVLSRDCWFLKLAGRWTPGAPGREEGLAPDEFVWLPVKETDMSGMLNGAKVDPARPISEKSALRVLRMALRKAGVRDAEQRRVHDLRHARASAARVES